VSESAAVARSLTVCPAAGAIAASSIVACASAALHAAALLPAATEEAIGSRASIAALALSVVTQGTAAVDAVKCGFGPHLHSDGMALMHISGNDAALAIGRASARSPASGHRWSPFGVASSVFTVACGGAITAGAYAADSQTVAGMPFIGRDAVS